MLEPLYILESATTPNPGQNLVGMIDEVAPKPVRPLRYKQPKAIDTADFINTGVSLDMADARTLHIRCQSEPAKAGVGLALLLADDSHSPRVGRVRCRTKEAMPHCRPAA